MSCPSGHGVTFLPCKFRCLVQGNSHFHTLDGYEMKAAFVSYFFVLRVINSDLTSY